EDDADDERGLETFAKHHDACTHLFRSPRPVALPLPVRDTLHRTPETIVAERRERQTGGDVARAQGHSVDEYLETIYFLAFPIGEYRPATGTTAIAARVAEMLGVPRAPAGGV